MSSNNSQFIFNESTANCQEMAIQGHLAYRFETSLEAAKFLDFSIDPASGKYCKKAGEKLSQRVINAVQAHTQSD